MGSETVLVVDDEVKVNQVIEAYLKKEGYRVLVAADGDTALDLALLEKPDLVILDLNLPKLSGEEVCKMIRMESNVPIIMLTAKTSESSRIIGLDLGADDYVSKPFSPRELMARVRAILRRSTDRIAAGKVLSFDNNRLIIDTIKHEVTVNDELINLTVKEFSLLYSLASNAGAALTRAQLNEAIEGYAYEGSDRTIDSHIRNLRQKIESAPDRPSYIKTVFGVGYKFDIENKDRL